MTRLLSRVWALIAFAFYLPIFFLPLPPAFESQGIDLVDELLALALCALILFALLRTGWLWKAIALAATLSIFTVPLLRTWETAASGHNLVLGLLPFVDANGYYSDALRLISGRLFTAQGVYRPLFTAFLAAFLKALNGNVQLAAVLFAILAGLGIFSLVVEARRIYGVWAAVTVVFFTQFYYRQFVGAPMTEQLGLSIGGFGLAALFQAMQKRNRWLYACALFLLSLAVTIRAGAYFALPLLILFGLYLLRDQFSPSPGVAEGRAEAAKRPPVTGRRLFRFARTIIPTGLLFSISILLPIGMDALVRGWVVIPGTVTSGNFAMTLYGQAVGGRGWRSIFVDHPELSTLPLYELGRPAYQYAFEALLEDPSRMARASVKSVIAYFAPAYLFNVIQLRNQTVTLAVQAVSYLFFLAGLWFTWRKRRDPYHALLLIFLAGIVISVPFLPPFDGGSWWGGIRVHAGTIGVHLLITGIGLSEALRRIPRPVFQPKVETADEGHVLFWTLGIILAVFTILGPWAIHPTGERVSLPPIACAPGEDVAYFRLSPGSYIRIERDDSGLETYVPIVLMKHAERSMRDFPHGEFAAVPRRINERAIFTAAVDWGESSHPLWIVAPPELAELEGNLVAVCGEKVEVWGAVDFPLKVFYVRAFR